MGGGGGQFSTTTEISEAATYISFSMYPEPEHFILICVMMK